MGARNKTLGGGFYLTNLYITKKHVWPKPMFGFYMLDKVTKLVIDRLIKEYPHKGLIPMQLIQIYEKIERCLKKRNSLRMRLEYYVKYSAYLYAYIEHHLGKGEAEKLFAQACQEVSHRGMGEVQAIK